MVQLRGCSQSCCSPFEANLVVRPSRWAISQVLAAFQVIYDKVVRRKNFRQAGLFSGEYFGCLEVLEILVVALNQNLVIGALEVVSPLFSVCTMASSSQT